MRPSCALARGIAVLLLCISMDGAQSQVRPAANPRAIGGPSATAAIHLATLAERIAKLHAQIGQGVLAERSRRALGESVRDFDATLRAVAARAPTAEIRDNYALLALVWQDYRDWAMRTPTRENARKLRARAEEVVWIAGKGARMIQEQARGSTNASAVRAAGAATLAQRIAKAHLWMRWDIRDDALRQELRAADENLRRTLDTLRSSPGNTPAISAELEAAESQMRFLGDAERELERREAAARAIEFIAKTGDHIYESMERLARLYEDGS